MGTFWQDLKFAIRSLKRKPGFSAIVILTLALGIGANAAVFTLVDAVILRPLPFHNPQQLVMLWEKPPEFDHNSVSGLTYLDWHDQSISFQSMAGIASGKSAITTPGAPTQVTSESVSQQYFDLLGVTPEMGRTFTQDDLRAGRGNVAVISHRFWLQQFVANSGAIGASMAIDGKSYTLIGVLPADFHLVEDCDVWIPLVLERGKATRNSHFLRVIGRLKPSVSLEVARAEMSVIASHIGEVSPETNRGWGVKVAPLQQELIGPELSQTSMILFGAVAFVLLIACANVANLLLVRGATRTREIAVRASLGAGRLRIARQLLTESLLLSVCGAGIGLFLARLMLETAPSWLPAETLPVAVQLRLDTRVLGFALFAAVLTGILCGLAPAIRAGRVNLNEALRTSSLSSTGGRRVRSALTIVEIALSVVLLAGASLLVRTLWDLEQVDRGYHTNRVLSFKISLPQNRFGDTEASLAFYRNTLSALSGLPGVRAAALGTDLPLDGWSFGEPFEIASRPTGQLASRTFAHYQVISPRYFDSLAIPMIRGRAFTDQDTAKSEQVCIVNEELARQYLKEREPVGVQLIHGDSSCVIVGISGQVRIEGPAESSRFELYVPYTQKSLPSTSVVIRTEVDPGSLASAVRAAMQGIDKDLPLAKMRTLDEIASNSVARPRFRALLTGAFAALAMALAMIGVYGVLAHAVTQRVREFGIRIALGAQRVEVLKLVIGDGLRIALAGVGIGVVAAMMVTRFLSSMLFGVHALDPVTFVSVPVLLAIAVVAACYIPARRATKVDPLVALRYE